ncbi:dipeptide ABC transporter ATP-binding protein [uncultured Roseobacter sp.]|uniref:ABC transporter ATP-binding protein n=1 Tax=uncultured Roseobacter sp. TaxID=114847 RepID=UPI0026249FB9|nr:dipeptide ABC transporter ATP-binding protein [uncultured Roseobacter sp.]
MTLLSVENLAVNIAGTQVLEQVSLNVAPGEILAITGESGSGKSMTALAVMQLLPQGAAMSGQIRLGDETISEMSEAQLCNLRGKDIGMIFQEPMTALNPVQTIGAQVAETIRLHDGASAAEARTRAANVLTRVGLPQDQFPLSRYPHELSGGQRQRVVIAIAIALRPRLLIADEPTTALDVTTQAQILDLLTGLVREFGMGLIMITHDLAVVSQMADRIAVMKDGNIVETGATQSLLSKMQHPYTRALFAASAHRVSLPPAQAHRPLLELKGVSRTYPGARTGLFARAAPTKAVRDVSFQICQGERVGLVGESGCGKSTLTRAVLGLDTIDAGSIKLDGTPVLRAGRPDHAIRRRMQVVFQDPFGSFNPRHTVERLITEPFFLLEEPLSPARRQDAIRAALTDVGLHPDDAHRYIHEFSGGQRQRIAIARALILRPDLIVFDEAVSALDVSVRARILDLLADLCRSYGLTWLFISHDLSVVRTITDRVLVMQSGRIVEEGPTETVFSNPQHSCTKELLAAAPVLRVPAAESGSGA